MPDATVAAMSVAVGRLASEIASRVTALRAESVAERIVRRLPARDSSLSPLPGERGHRVPQPAQLFAARLDGPSRSARRARRIRSN